MSRLRGVCMLTGLLAAVVLAGCSAPTPTPQPTITSATATATPTATPSSFSPDWHVGVLPLPTGFIGTIIPSPDGRLLALLYSPPVQLRLVTFAGAQVGQYQVSAANSLTAAWLTDGSALAIAVTSPTSDASGPLLLMDTQGALHPMGVSAALPVLSPDGRWLAATRFGTADSTTDAVLLMPRAGGSAQTLAHGADFIGWLQDHLVYAQGTRLYAVTLPSQSTTFLGTIPGEGTVSSAGLPAQSPDDSALVVYGAPSLPPWLVTARGITHLPGDTIGASPVYWVGPHAVLGVSTQGTLYSIDLSTGRLTAIASLGPNPGGFAAVAYPWVAVMFDDQLSLVNARTGANDYVWYFPTPGTLSACGPGFVFDGDNAAYAITPTSAS